jgi:hypothetical protein
VQSLDFDYYPQLLTALYHLAQKFELEGLWALELAKLK